MGAIGSVISCLLKKNELLTLSYYSRTPKDNIRVLSERHEYHIKTDEINKINHNEKLDWLIICLKEYHFKNATDWFLKLIKPDVKVVCIRNGLYHKIPHNFFDEIFSVVLSIHILYEIFINLK